ncbi:hypothetical protein FRX31_004415 [Thalictrum thalictroides]|uniref:Uncharacterized protein n=1 Tax=Thalictrum thalictroides TaxID=46969 RepID=A0A7J6X981_THATH|nr:hypothetical protein FRX31_004415 [Thalictrum thalictroides]
MDPRQEIRDRFQDLEHITFGECSRVDWDDTMLCGKKAVRFYTMTNTDIVELGSRVLTDIMQSVTDETVGAVVLIAWNLRNPADLTQSIFPNYSPCASLEDVEYYSLSREVPIYNPRVRGTLTFPMSIPAAAASICYVCASLLRLFTKPVNNYLNAIPYIISTFSDFYQFAFPLAWYNPPKDSLEAMSFKFRSNPIFKYGMAGMLYLHNEIPIAQGLRTTLYEQHLSCTGMHAYTLFVGIQKAFGVTVEDIENRKRMTWKYARIFDSAFFKSIQTKNCSNLVYFLAYLSVLTGIQDESVLQISHLANVSEPNKQHLHHDAQVIYNSLLAGKAGRVSTLEEKQQSDCHTQNPFAQG